MQSVAQALDEYVLPELYIRRQNPFNRGGKVAPHPRQEFMVIRRWDSFEEELSEFKGELEKAFNEKLVKMHSQSVRSKYCVKANFQSNIERNLYSILESMGHDYMITHPSGIPSIFFDSEAVLVDSAHLQDPLCLFEFCSPWECPMDEDMDVAAYIRQEEQTIFKSSRNMSISVAQLYGSMVCNSMKYGVLSNYDYSIFFSRPSTEEPTLLYSMPVPKSRILRVLTQFFFVIRGNPKYSPPTTGFINELKEFQHDNNKLKIINRENYMFTEGMTYIENGGVIRGNLGGVEGGVVFKLKNICRWDELGESLKEEADNYLALADLQGIAIPRFHGLVDINGVFHGLITEHCGVRLPDMADECLISYFKKNGDVEALENYMRELQSESHQLKFDPEIKENALAALALIHAKGYLHGDIAERNICVDRSTKKVRLIDLERIKQSEDPAIFAKEMEQLRCHFP